MAPTCQKHKFLVSAHPLRPSNSPINLNSSLNLVFPNSPDPWKVAIILEGLVFEYKVIRLDIFSVKKALLTDLNPNARTPVIVDHNNDGFIFWE